MHTKRLTFRVLTILFLISPSVVFSQVVFDQKFDIPLTEDEETMENPWIGGLNSSQYNKVDLNGDEKEELLLYDRSGNIYQIFELEEGELIPANELEVYLPDIPAGWVLFVDYNYDGKKDIYSNGSRGIIVYKNVTLEGEPATWEKAADPLLTTGFSGKINLIANRADVPAITDIDDDGDIDILVYNFAVGGYIRYNKNLSQELFGHSDSLEYEINTRTWGHFEECECNLFAFGEETCQDIYNGRVTHAGGKALLAFDNDGDGDKDLLVGHEQCIEFYFYENMGDRDSAYMVDYSNQFPEATQAANFHIFPAGYFEDLDFDGVKDLIVTPSFEENVEYKIDFAHSNWFYKNMGSENNPSFQFKQNDLLQGEMLDFGEHTVPVLRDINGDGKTDLLVAANGYWNGENYVGFVNVLENIGTVSDPSFAVIDKDYLNLSSLDLINPKIDLVDFDGDGAHDLVYSGTVLPNTSASWLFINQAGEGEHYEFDLENREVIILPEDMSIKDSPTYYDVNEDASPDLLLGNSDGSLGYFSNNGDNTFTLEDPAYLGIERDFSLERLNTVVSVGDIDFNGVADLIASDSRGLGRVYFDFQRQESDYISVDFAYNNTLSVQHESLKLDQKSWISSSNIFDKGNESIIVGGVRGGLQIFENTSIGNGGGEEGEIVVNIYPNPIYDPTGLHIRSNQNVTVEVISLLGQRLISPFNVNQFVTAVLDVAHMRNGTYILRSKNDLGISSSQLFMILR